MFKETSHIGKGVIIDLIRALPERDQRAIVKTLTAKPKKKLTKKAKKKQEILMGIAEGMREIKEAKRTGKKRKTLEEFLNEL